MSKADYNSKTSASVTVSAAQELTGTVKIQKGGADVTTASTGDTLSAVYNGSETGLTYQWNKDGTAITTGGTGTTYTPATAGSSIGASAFWVCRALTSITIPAGITSIEPNAFYYCDKLASITLPANVTSIGEYAFYQCNSLTSVTFETGSITEGNFASLRSFPGDLRAKYLDAGGGAGTYTRVAISTSPWTKQP